MSLLALRPTSFISSRRAAIAAALVLSACSSSDSGGGGGSSGSAGRGGSGAAGSASAGSGGANAGRSGGTGGGGTSGGVAGNQGSGGATAGSGGGGAAGKSGGAGGQSTGGAGGGSAGASGTGGRAGTGGGAAGMGGGGAGGSAGTGGAGPIASGTPAAVLDGLRWELPCARPEGDGQLGCYWDSTKFQKSWELVKTFGGDPAKTYQVKLRFRGVVEPRTYVDADGKNVTTNTKPRFLVGGHPRTDDSTDFNDYGIAVAEPAQNYYLNAYFATEHWVFGIDYEATITVKGGSKVTLFGHDGNDLEINNTASTARGNGPNDSLGKAIEIPGIPNQADGQWIQVNVVEVRESP